ncbi:MAG TPA: hypothetical protein VJ917_02690 [Saprospiraceae bacterium]|nr:hypothetical protein [Saprospiraceae bacterium]
MSAAYYSESAAEESLEKAALSKETVLVDLVNEWQSLFDFVLSDPELTLTNEEKDYLFFFCSWAASILKTHNISPVALTVIKKEEDRFWASFEKQKEQQKVSDYIFERYPEEELLAICEDAFHPVEDELDGVSSRELQDLLLVKFAVIFDFLHSDSTA